jgi:dolichol-phosphate mannosyltransferase
MRTAVIITTLNEAETIGPLVSYLANLYKVAVIDESSADGTVKAAELNGAYVITMPSRAGIGRCLERGLMWAQNMDFDRAAIIDAGGSHDPTELERLLSVNVDIVIGSRFIKGSDYHGRPFRALMSRLAALACNLARRGAVVNDWTSGYRVYSRAAIEEILSRSYRSTMHGWQIEVLEQCLAAGLSVTEAPITYTAGRSSFNLKVAIEAASVWLHTINRTGRRAK